MRRYARVSEHENLCQGHLKITRTDAGLKLEYTHSHDGHVATPVLDHVDFDRKVTNQHAIYIAFRIYRSKVTIDQEYTGGYMDRKRGEGAIAGPATMSPSSDYPDGDHFKSCGSSRIMQDSKGRMPTEHYDVCSTPSDLSKASLSDEQFDSSQTYSKTFYSSTESRKIPDGSSIEKSSLDGTTMSKSDNSNGKYDKLSEIPSDEEDEDKFKQHQY